MDSCTLSSELHLQGSLVSLESEAGWRRPGGICWRTTAAGSSSRRLQRAEEPDRLPCQELELLWAERVAWLEKPRSPVVDLLP